jgi:hypothetical protein
MKITKNLIDAIDITENHGDLATFFAKKVYECYGVKLSPEDVFNIYHKDELTAQEIVDWA